MPGYIKKFTQLSPQERQLELDKTISAACGRIPRSGRFKGLLKHFITIGHLKVADPSEWDIETTSTSVPVINEKEICCEVKYVAVRNSLFAADGQQEFPSTITAVLDDEGKVNFKSAACKPVTQSVGASQPKRERFPFGSEEWHEQHAQLSWWRDAEESDAKYQNFSKKYHIQINQYASGWAYTIRPYGEPDKVLDHDDGYDTIEEVIDAALCSLVEIWNAGP